MQVLVVRLIRWAFLLGALVFSGCGAFFFRAEVRQPKLGLIASVDTTEAVQGAGAFLRVSVVHYGGPEVAISYFGTLPVATTARLVTPPDSDYVPALDGFESAELERMYEEQGLRAYWANQLALLPTYGGEHINISIFVAARDTVAFDPIPLLLPDSPGRYRLDVCPSFEPRASCAEPLTIDVRSHSAG